MAQKAQSPPFPRAVPSPGWFTPGHILHHCGMIPPDSTCRLGRAHHQQSPPPFPPPTTHALCGEEKLRHEPFLRAGLAGRGGFLSLQGLRLFSPFLYPRTSAKRRGETARPEVWTFPLRPRPQDTGNDKYPDSLSLLWFPGPAQTGAALPYAAGDSSITETRPAPSWPQSDAIQPGEPRCWWLSLRGPVGVHSGHSSLL